MIVYCWRCPECERKGATNIKPVNIERCLTCNVELIIVANQSIFNYV